MNVDEFEERPESKPENSSVKPGVPEKFEPAKTATKTEAQAKSPGRLDGDAGKRTGGGVAWLAVLLALLALAAAAWLWWQDSQSRQQQAAQWRAEQQVYLDELKRLESSLANLQSAGSQQSAELSGDLQRRLEVLESNRDSGESFRTETAAWNRAAQAALEESQARLAAVDERLRNLSARSAESSTELELEEIDYLLRMAQERLELFGDTRTADRALQLADQQVQAFDSPMFIGLRREITAARQALTAADLPDIVALSAELDKVQESISGLPFLSSGDDRTTESTDAEAEVHWWDRLKNALSGLVTVRRIDENELAIPALADQQALRQRAWLELEQARLAALRREQDIYQASLAQAGETIDRWFDNGDAQVKLALTSIAALSRRNVNPELPDISGPWTVLNSIREAGLSPAVSDEVAEPAVAPGSSAAASPAPLESENNSDDDSAVAILPVGLPTAEQPAEEQPTQESLEDNDLDEAGPEEAALEDDQPTTAKDPGQ